MQTSYYTIRPNLSKLVSSTFKLKAGNSCDKIRQN